MIGDVLEEIKKDIKDDEEHNIEYLPISLVKHWISVIEEHQNINCQNCQYFVSDSASSDCLRRNDIGYEGTCIDGMDLHKLAKNCPYY